MPDEEEAPNPRYGVALIAVLIAVLASAFADREGWVAVLSLLLEGGVLVFVLRTSGARRGIRTAAILITLVGVAVGLVAILTGNRGQPTLFSDAIGLLMAVAVPIVILRRLAEKRVVDFQTVAGALIIYLLIGFAFSLVYRNLDGRDGQPMFVQTDEATALDTVYFSYVTMTTVGYGDLSAATDLGRLLAISEALIGQLYLVSVVALTVSRVGSATIGSRRRERDGPDG
ncbi:MAG TPA: potassium channel family protein [Actinomycetota bacterium]